MWRGVKQKEDTKILQNVMICSPDTASYPDRYESSAMLLSEPQNSQTERH